MADIVTDLPLANGRFPNLSEAADRCLQRKAGLVRISAAPDGDVIRVRGGLRTGAGAAAPSGTRMARLGTFLENGRKNNGMA